MQSEINKLHEELQKLEEVQNRIDRKTKDAAAYKESNIQLINLLKFSFVAIVLCVAIFCITLLFTFDKSQKDLYNWISGSTIETVEETEDMSTSDNGIILNDVSNSSFEQANTY